MGRQQRRLHRRRCRDRHRLAPAAEGTQAAAARPAPRRDRHPASSAGRCTRSTSRRRPSGLADDPDRRAFGAVDRRRLRRSRRADRGHRRRASNPRTAARFDQLPFALTPGPPIQRPGPLQDSIEATAADVAAGLPNLPPSAVIDILLRQPPAHPQRRAASPRRRTSPTSITAALLDLDSSYLAVHGPPGHRQDVHRRPRSSPGSSPNTIGASASSRSRTPSSRTCSAT